MYGGSYLFSPLCDMIASLCDMIAGHVVKMYHVVSGKNLV
jgi:hypothetical protein